MKNFNFYRNRWLAIFVVALLFAGGVGAPFLRAALSPGAQNLGPIWFIGDSITQGGSDNSKTKTPRSCLYNLLAAKGYAFDFTGHNTLNPEGLPVTGRTPDDNLYQYHSGFAGAVIGSDIPSHLGITQNLPTWWTTGRLGLEKPNLILVMIGTNDVDLNLDLPHAADRLRNLLTTIYALPGVGRPTVLLANIPPNRRDAARTAAVTSFNASVPQIVQDFQVAGRDIYFVDQFAKLDRYFTSYMLNSNNLHPNGEGDKIIAEKWFATIQARLQAPTPTPTPTPAPSATPSPSPTPGGTPNTGPGALEVRAAVADSYVRDGGSEAKNFGSTPDLVSKLVTTYTGYSRQIYLKFNVQNVPTDSRLVKLRLFGSRSPDGVVTTTTSESVCGGASDAWTESGLTWKNRPAAVGTALSSVHISGQTGQWWEWDVSSFVLARIAANSPFVTLIVSMDQMPVGDEGFDVFNSRNASANPPQLTFSSTTSPAR